MSFSKSTLDYIKNNVEKAKEVASFLARRPSSPRC